MNLTVYLPDEFGARVKAAEDLNVSRICAEALAREIGAPWQKPRSLRDEFAMAALTGILAMPAPPTADVDVQETVGAAYGIADAMLAERAKP